MQADAELAARVVDKVEVDFDVIVGDELCFRELGPAFRSLKTGPARVLLVHHLRRWEADCDQATWVREQLVLDHADACVATSGETARRLASEGCQRNIHVAEPGADRLSRLPRATRTENQAEEVRFVFVGNLVRRKNLPVLLDAFARSNAPRSRLLLIGDESREPDHAAELRAHCPPGVSFAGAVDDAALAAALADADALVMPSAVEGYGMALAEALFAGLPVIATRVGAAAALGESTGACVLVEPGDPVGLGGALATFAGDSALRARVRAAAGQASGLPCWRDTVTAFRVALRRSLIAKRAGRGARPAPAR